MGPNCRISELLFTKRKDVLIQDLMKSRSREIRCYNHRIVLKLDMQRCCRSACQIQSSVKPNLREILRCDVRPLSEQMPWLSVSGHRVEAKHTNERCWNLFPLSRVLSNSRQFLWFLAAFYCALEKKRIIIPSAKDDCYELCKYSCRFLSTLLPEITPTEKWISFSQFPCQYRFSVEIHA